MPKEQLAASSPSSEPTQSTVKPVENFGGLQDLSQTEFESSYQHTDLNLWEQSISVHQDLPAFVIQLYGDQDVYTELSIVNSSTGMVVYQEHYDLDWGCISKERFFIEIKI